MITQEELLNSPIENRLEFLKVEALKEQNEISKRQAQAQEKRIDALIKVGKYSLIGTVIASMIGAGTLIIVDMPKNFLQYECNLIK